MARMSPELQAASLMRVSPTAPFSFSLFVSSNTGVDILKESEINCMESYRK